ncbi:MAG: hypothetical protein Q4G50_02785 [Corynebacterium sp.]|nr:hypothetical protein [Corynebacterium sp.]
MIMPAPQQLTPENPARIIYSDTLLKKGTTRHTPTNPEHIQTSQHTQPTTTNKSTLAHY